jgi:hypothetical protein
MVLFRIEIESAHHGGKENGRLPITYDDFENYGIHRHAICPGIRELLAFMFIEITERGRAGNAEFRKPNVFRLTYRHAKGEAGDGTHEWRSLSNITMEQAREIARRARAGETTTLPSSKKLDFFKIENGELVPRLISELKREHTAALAAIKVDKTGRWS